MLRRKISVIKPSVINIFFRMKISFLIPSGITESGDGLEDISYYTHDAFPVV